MAVDEERLEAAARNSAGRRRSRRTSETPQGMWFGGAWKGSLWLENRKERCQVIGEDRSRFPERETVGEVRREQDEEEEPVTERRREYPDFGLDLGEREEQVVCHASALALAMTKEARREAEM